MPTTWDGEAAFVGEGIWTDTPATLTLDAGAALIGDGEWLDLPATMTMNALTFNFAASGLLSAIATKPPNRIAARFAGTSSMNVVTIAPRLVASARFVGEGLLVQVSNTSSSILSTSASVRMSFPTHPNSGDPFTRRPSKSYNNYSISARFSGAGRLTSIAS